MPLIILPQAQTMHLIPLPLVQTMPLILLLLVLTMPLTPLPLVLTMPRVSTISLPRPLFTSCRRLTSVMGHLMGRLLHQAILRQ